ncbi:hypothetical protein [Synechococcus phage Ssp-JY38]|nr:L-alanyl-D-glutamate peptidase [Synechococcus phage Yong-L2-223]
MSTLAFELQTALNEAGVGPLAVDGRIGPATKAAIRRFQKKHGLAPDGIAGPKTRAALGMVTGIDRSVPKRAPASPKAAKQWPRQADVVSVFGSPGNPACTAGRVRLPSSMRIAWNTSQLISQFSCHTLVEDAFTSIFAETIKHYGPDEWRRLGLDLFGGCYNLRKMRGGSSYSMHSWGIAVDIDPVRNQLKWGKDRAQLARSEYAAWWDIVEEHGMLSLGRARNYDWMHFQAARL